MMSGKLKNDLLEFAHHVDKYYGMVVKISEFITTNKFDRHFTTFNCFELRLERVDWRVSGGRMTFRQQDLQYEVSIDNLSKFRIRGEWRFEFLEIYGESVFRKTLLEF